MLDDVAEGGKEANLGPYKTPPSSDPLKILGEYGGNLDGHEGSGCW